MRAVEALSSGRPVWLLGWCRWQCTGEILHADGPLLQVAYQLASGRAGTAWIGVLRLNGGPA
jgi:hypothetical protein